MVIKAFDAGFQIRELAIEKERGQVRLKWRFKEADYFLVFLYESATEFVLKDILDELEENGLLDEDIIHNPQKKVFGGEKERLKVFCIRRKEFVNSGKKFLIPGNEIQDGMPYTARVYACMYDDSQGALFVYNSGSNENAVILQVTVKPEITYKKLGLLSGNGRIMCTLRLPELKGYKDGTIMYSIDGVKGSFPLTAGCLGKNLILMIPAASRVCVQIQEEYRKYYRKV